MYLDKISGDIDQGDVLYPVKIKEYIPWWGDDSSYPIIVLTPTCDIAHKKADYHKFGILESFPLFFIRLCETILDTNDFNVETISSTKKTKINNKLKKAITNAWPRYHFLMADGKISKTNRIIDFEIILSTPISEFNPGLRVARLCNPYKENLIHRFSHHVMRIGTPDIPTDKVKDLVDKCYKYKSETNST